MFEVTASTSAGSAIGMPLCWPYLARHRKVRHCLGRKNGRWHHSRQGKRFWKRVTHGHYQAMIIRIMAMIHDDKGCETSRSYSRSALSSFISAT